MWWSCSELGAQTYSNNKPCQSQQPFSRGACSALSHSIIASSERCPHNNNNTQRNNRTPSWNQQVSAAASASLTKVPYPHQSPTNIKGKSLYRCLCPTACPLACIISQMLWFSLWCDTPYVLRCYTAAVLLYVIVEERKRSRRQRKRACVCVRMRLLCVVTDNSAE